MSWDDGHISVWDCLRRSGRIALDTVQDRSSLCHPGVPVTDLQLRYHGAVRPCLTLKAQFGRFIRQTCPPLATTVATIQIKCPAECQLYCQRESQRHDAPARVRSSNPKPVHPVSMIEDGRQTAVPRTDPLYLRVQSAIFPDVFLPVVFESSVGASFVEGMSIGNAANSGEGVGALLAVHLLERITWSDNGS